MDQQQPPGGPGDGIWQSAAVAQQNNNDFLFGTMPTPPLMQQQQQQQQLSGAPGGAAAAMSFNPLAVTGGDVSFGQFATDNLGDGNSTTTIPLDMQQQFLTDPLLQLPGLPPGIAAAVNGMPPGAGFDLAAQAAALASAGNGAGGILAPAVAPTVVSAVSNSTSSVAAQQPKQGGGGGGAVGGGGGQAQSAARRQRNLVPLAPLGPLAPLAPAGGGSVAPSLSGASSTGLQVPAMASAEAQLAAAEAAADAAVSASVQKDSAATTGASAAGGKKKGGRGKKAAGGKSNETLTAEQKAKLHRDRNREHARSTRLRKKAYVEKLKELVEGLRNERSEETRRRRVAVQHLAEQQRVRRAVIHTFLKFHVGYESDPRKWATILEDDFVFKQPVTPYRYFRRAEIDKDFRVARSIDAVIADAASMSVMVESIGSRSSRWMQIKREDFLSREEARNGGRRVSSSSSRRMPHSIVRQNSRLRHAVSSLSSSSGSSNENGSGAEEDRNLPSQVQVNQPSQVHAKLAKTSLSDKAGGKPGVKKVSSSSSGGGTSNPSSSQSSSNENLHDYHAAALPDPMLDSGSTGSRSTGSDDAVMADRARRGTKNVCTESSSNDEEQDVEPSPAKKRRKMAPAPAPTADGTGSGGDCSSLTVQSFPSMTGTQVENSGATAITALASQPSSSLGRLPPNIAKKEGISHNIRPIALDPQANARLSAAPAIQLPPFAGLGKRPLMPTAATTVGAAIVNKTPGAIPTSGSSGSEAAAANGAGAMAAHASFASGSGAMPAAVSKPAPENASGSGSANGNRSSRASPTAAGTQVAVIGDTASSSSQSSSQSSRISSTYHVNEDDMLLTEDVLMCPFIFRSQDAVSCGALADTVQPGMLRAQFSPAPRNKLVSLELVYDAMGFMQQLERASGSEGSAQIVPNSLEMALSPNPDEARVITLAKAPYKIVSVNEKWTRTTKYTQMEIEGKEMSVLNGNRTDPNAGKKSGKPIHDLGEVAKGRPACSVNVHYDKHGRDYIDFVSSYPLTNADDKITHILHVCRELPVPIQPPDIEFGSVSFLDQTTMTQ